MTNSIVPSNLTDLSKEFKTDKDGKGFVTRRGLGRMCGVTHKNFGKGGYKFTLEIDQYLSDAGIEVGTVKSDCSIPDPRAASKAESDLWDDGGICSTSIDYADESIDGEVIWIKSEEV